MKRRRMCLTAEQRAELLHVRDHHPLPYMRTKAAALLKVADGWPIRRVAASGRNPALSRRYGPKLDQSV